MIYLSQFKLEIALKQASIIILFILKLLYPLKHVGYTHIVWLSVVNEKNKKNMKFRIVQMKYNIMFSFIIQIYFLFVS